MILEQYIRCGRPNCHCANGGTRHGPYHYRVWREAGRVRKVYIPVADVERVRAQCDLYHDFRERLRLARGTLAARTGRVHRLVREAQRLLRGLGHPGGV